VASADLDSQLIAALRERRARVTLARLLVHRHVRSGESHVTAEQIQEALPTLSPATVYSTLDLLAELGFVRRLSTPAGVAVYDPRTQPHHHTICRSCGRMEDLDAEVEASAALRAAAAAGFEVEHGELQLSGLCAACAASEVSGPRTSR
jgi:Fur family transcriptional regulator, stress-responsive regulator